MKLIKRFHTSFSKVAGKNFLKIAHAIFFLTHAKLDVIYSYVYALHTTLLFAMIVDFYDFVHSSTSSAVESGKIVINII